MELAATQVYEDDDFLFTQKISHALEEEESVQVGTLSIDSIDYQIKKGITKIGRLNSCDIVINDATVSKLHAEIETSGGQGSTWICDLNSSNKTKLNNLTLQSTRSYELKDGSVIEFGKVRATFHRYCPVNNTVIPETPAPSRQKTMNTIIPNTPDSSLNNSSGLDDDGSIILGTQKDNENSVFRQPRIPQQCRSTSINKNNTSMNESNESQIAITLHKSDINISENQISIHDVETQKFEEGYKMASNSIYDMETQGDLIDIAEHIVEANVKTGKQLPKLNVHDKTAGKSTDIHDIETQNCIDDINEMETQKINTQNVTGKKFTTDIHIVMEMQKYTNDTDEGGNDAEKSEIDKNNIQEKSLARGQDIHNLETQKLDNKYIAEDISDLETQLELDSVARCENRDISDMETQFVTDMTNETSNDRVNKDKDKNDIIDITKNGLDIFQEGIDQENAKSKSRSSSPSSLNLSSPGVEDCPSPLNQSSHLLESSDLLEFFSEGIDKQEVQASNISTPKSLTKVSSDRSSNVENVQTMVNNEEDNDEDIFEAPTQRVSCNFEALMSDNSETDEENALVMCKVPKKKHGKSQLEQTNNDSETDAEEYVTELAKKQCKSSKILNNPPNEDINDKNDPGTSIESEDMFDVQTQRLNNSTIKDTSNSSINQSQNTNKINGTEVDDVASTQIVNNVDQTSASTSDINDMAPTLLVLSHETPKTVINSKDFALKNQNDLDDMTHIINAKSVDCCTIENLDREGTDYELAPTQLIGEIESKKKENSTCERSASEVNLNDTLEQKLNEMFDDVNNDTNSIHESPHMSTQYLENILESSQCASANKSIADNRDTDGMSQKQAEKKNDAFCNQQSHNLVDIEINTNNVHKEKNDSQNSDVYFSTITTRRKRNILRDTQELADSIEDTTPRHDINFSQASKTDNEKDRLVNDNIVVESNKKRKRISKTKNKSYGITEILNDNKTLSSENTERSLRSSKSMKQKDKAASETNKQVLRNPVKVDDAEENTSICTPCPSGNGQRAQTLDTLYESDDDILTRLPAVRMSGTLSNPASPSASSTSTVRSTKSKQNFVKNKEKKGISLGKKSRDIRNFDKNTKPSVDSHSNSVPDSLTSDKISGLVDTSDDSDSETNDYKRFQQLADRMLSNKLSCPKQQNKRSRKSAHVSPNVSEDSKKNMDVELKNPGRTSSRITRHSSRQSDESSHDFQKEACLKNTTYGVSIDSIDSKSMESEMKSAVAKRKTSLNVIKESTEQVTSKKRKTAQVIEECRVFTRSQRSTMKITTDPPQSPKIFEYFTKMSSHVSSSENIKSFEDNKAVSKTLLEETQKTSLNELSRTDGNVDSGRTNIKRTRNERIIYDSQATININDVTANENSKKNKLAETKGTEIQASRTQDKVLKILLSPIKNLADDESQEVERIMARDPSNTQDKNLSIRESKAKIFERELRTRSRKRQNSDTETDSVLTESSTSSVIEDSDNTQLDNSASKAKRERPAKNSIFSLPEAQVLIKKEIFKKPTRINQNSTSSILDSSTENTGESSQSSVESDTSTSSRLSRSKAASRKKEKMESNQNRLINKSTSRLNINVEVTSPVLTPSRTRRSTSVQNNSTPSAIKHKVLFTGITEDHSKIVKMLGGSKVEDLTKCTVLVTDKVRRTYKFLCALAKGVPIVAIEWLKDSEMAERFLDWENYILKDPAAEAKFGFRLRKSLDKAKEKKLLDGYSVVLTPNVAPPPIEELKDIVSSCGGKALLRPPIKWPERALILSREEDLPNAKKFLAKAPKTVTVQSTEFILTGILRQETDFIKYKLT